jgi:hypothetical protein
MDNSSRRRRSVEVVEWSGFGFLPGRAGAPRAWGSASLAAMHGAKHPQPTESAMTNLDFEATFIALRAILEPYAARLIVKRDEPDVYYLDAPAGATNGREMFFGSVQVKKGYVAYHLMPVYIFPDLLEGISPDLRKRMQGKSCFNFKRSDPALFDELAALTRAGFDRYGVEGYR